MRKVLSAESCNLNRDYGWEKIKDNMWVFIYKNSKLVKLKHEGRGNYKIVKIYGLLTKKEKGVINHLIEGEI